MLGDEWTTTHHGGPVACHVEVSDIRARPVLGGEASRHVEAGDRREDGAIESIAEVAPAIGHVEERDISQCRTPQPRVSRKAPITAVASGAGVTHPCRRSLRRHRTTRAYVTHAEHDAPVLRPPLRRVIRSDRISIAEPPRGHHVSPYALRNQELPDGVGALL